MTKKKFDWDELDEQIDSWAETVDKKNKDIDWQKLSKDLQVALMEEIKQNEEYEEVIQMMNTIIAYLEIRLGIYRGKEDGNESV